MNYEKPIWELFKMNRDDFNKADKKIEKILRGVFEQGRKSGKKETIQSLKVYTKYLK